MPPESTHWAVCQVETQREHVARLLLMRDGLTTYLPRCKERNRIKPLFPGYLFVELEDGRWYSILRTPHVVRMLMSGETPARVPNGLVEKIRAHEHNGLVKLPEIDRELRKGQKIRVLNGSFAGKIGVYEGQSGALRQRVLLDLLGQSVIVTMPSKDVEPLDVAQRKRVCY